MAAAAFRTAVDLILAQFWLFDFISGLIKLIEDIQSISLIPGNQTQSKWPELIK